jgi:hypothetical protein
MEVLNFAFFLFVLLGPVAVGAYAVLFSRRFSVGSLEFRKRVFKMGYSETEVKVGRVFGILFGSFLFIGGLLNAAKYLLP